MLKLYISIQIQREPLKSARMHNTSYSAWMEHVSKRLLQLRNNRTNRHSVLNILKREIRGIVCAK